MQKHTKQYLLPGLGLILVLLLIVALVGGTHINKAPELSYRLINKTGAIEVRSYPSYIVAEINVVGDRKTAINSGFKDLADYLFGQNARQQKMAMTIPLLQQAYTPLANTKVTHSSPTWTIRTILPSDYSLANLPRPKQAQIHLRVIPSTCMLTIRFSGFVNTNRLNQQLTLLNEYATSQHLITQSSPVYAFYNPPWSLPFLRRNELMLQLTSCTS